MTSARAIMKLDPLSYKTVIGDLLPDFLPEGHTAIIHASLPPLTGYTVSHVETGLLLGSGPQPDDAVFNALCTIRLLESVDNETLLSILNKQVKRMEEHWMKNLINSTTRGQ